MKIRMLAMTALLALATASAQEPERTFSQGMYRQDGRCSRLLVLGKDQTPSCATWLGVWAKRNDIPEFMFHHGTKGLTVFIASGQATFTAANTRILYKIGTVFEMDTGVIYDVDGECSLSIGVDDEVVTCEAWSDEKKTKLAFAAEFQGGGMWIHKPKS